MWSKTLKKISFTFFEDEIDIVLDLKFDLKIRFIRDVPEIIDIDNFSD